jgi:hypothetical protein
VRYTVSVVAVATKQKKRPRCLNKTSNSRPHFCVSGISVPLITLQLFPHSQWHGLPCWHRHYFNKWIALLFHQALINMFSLKTMHPGDWDSNNGIIKCFAGDVICNSISVRMANTTCIHSMTHTGIPAHGREGLVQTIISIHSPILDLIPPDQTHSELQGIAFKSPIPTSCCWLKY